MAALAGVSRPAFYAKFADKRQCLSAAHDAFFERLISETLSAVDFEQEWPRQLKDAVFAALEFVDETASRARFFAVEVLVAGPVVIERHTSALERLASLLRQGRAHFPQAADLPELTEMVLIAGAAYKLFSCLLDEERLSVATLAAELVETLLTPYLGRQEARRVAIA